MYAPSRLTPIRVPRQGTFAFKAHGVGPAHFDDYAKELLRLAQGYDIPHDRRGH